MNLDPVEREIESALASLTPAPARIDRDRLMFEAGRRDAMNAFRRRVNGWRVVTGALAAGLLASVSLHSLHWQETVPDAPRTNVMTATTRRHEQPHRMAVPDTDSAVVVLGGIDADFPEPALPAASYGAMQRRWRSGDDAWLDPGEPVRGVNPRARDLGAGWGARSGMIGNGNELSGRGGRL
jgi:hypothetical protein